jgi:hypothetical protein
MDAQFKCSFGNEKFLRFFHVRVSMESEWKKLLGYFNVSTVVRVNMNGG